MAGLQDASAGAGDRRGQGPGWWTILRRYGHGRGRDVWGMSIHFLLKEAAARLIPVYVFLSVGLLERGDPDWAVKLALFTAVQTALLLWNIPGHVLHAKHLSRMCRGYGQDLRFEVCRQLQQMSVLYHGREGTGKFHSKLVRDIDSIESIPMNVAQPVLQTFPIVLVTVVSIAIQAPLVAPVFLLLLPLIFLISRTFRRKLQESATAYRETTERLSGRLQDMLVMIPVTRAHGLEEEELKRAGDRIEDVRREAGKFDVTSALFNASSWSLITMFNIFFLAAMVAFAAKGLITIADVVLFQGLFGQMTMGVMVALGVVPQVVRLRDSFASVEEVLSAPDIEENRGGAVVERPEGAIELRDVRFSYPGSTQAALDGIDLRIAPGEAVAIVGPSGGGKSTLLSVVLGFLRPEHGAVLLDGRDMGDLDMRTWRRSAAVVTQSSVFFSGTIRENIAHGLDHRHDAEIRTALELAGASEFIDLMDDGVETRIGTGGRSLSGGQMQRLALARALLRDPRVLVLDEPTSALDAESEVAFRRALRNVLPGRTVIMVSHGLMNARSFPRVLVVERGRITADGPPSELERGENFYARTVRELSVS
ncbi:MAG: ABC transporter ATP-binding protein [Planctomycetota bacterium]